MKKVTAFLLCFALMFVSISFIVPDNTAHAATKQELEDKIKDLKEELFNLRFQNATNQLDNPMSIVSVKKDIARVKTVLKEKELGINTSQNA